MRTVIVDDEPLARTRLAALLSQCDDISVDGTFGDADTALAACLEGKCDLLLADIDMPGMSGTELARRLARLPRPPQVVFCTAYDHFAAEAFELGAADYLLKPVRLERLREALERARRLQQQEAPQRPTLAMRMGNEEQSIALDRVLYLLAGDKYVSVYHDAGTSLTDTSLRQLAAQFPDEFVRLHRNCLVPRQRLLGLVTSSDGQVLARLAGCDYTPDVSRRNLPQIRRLLRET